MSATECRYCEQQHAREFLCDPARRVLDALYAQGQRFDMPTIEFPEPVTHADAFGGGTLLIAQVVVKAGIIPIAGVPRPVLIFTGRDMDGGMLPSWLYVGTPIEIKKVVQLVADMGTMAIRRARQQMTGGPS